MSKTVLFFEGCQRSNFRFLYIFVVTKKTYILTVAPGVDASLILAICICLDVATRPNNSSTNAASFSGGAAAAGGGGGAAGGGC